MPVAYFFLLPVAFDSTRKKPDSSTSLWVATESSEWQESRLSIAIFWFACFEFLSSPFPADEKFTGAIPTWLTYLHWEIFWCPQSLKAASQQYAMLFFLTNAVSWLIIVSKKTAVSHNLFRFWNTADTVFLFSCKKILSPLYPLVSAIVTLVIGVR